MAKQKEPEKVLLPTLGEQEALFALVRHANQILKASKLTSKESKRMKQKPHIIGIVGKAGSGKNTIAKTIDRLVSQVAGHAVETLALADPIKNYCQQVFHFSAHQLWGASHYRNAPDLRLSYPPPPKWWQRIIQPTSSRKWEEECLAVRTSREYVWNRHDRISNQWLRSILPAGVSWRAHHTLDQWLRTALEADTITPRQILQTLGTEWGRAYNPDIWVDCLERQITQYRDSHSIILVSDVRFPNEAQLIQRLGGEIWVANRPPKGNPKAIYQHESEALASTDLKSIVVDRVIDNTGTKDQLTKLIGDILSEKGII